MPSHTVLCSDPRHPARQRWYYLPQDKYWGCGRWTATVDSLPVCIDTKVLYAARQLISFCNFSHGWKVLTVVQRAVGQAGTETTGQERNIHVIGAQLGSQSPGKWTTTAVVPCLLPQVWRIAVELVFDVHSIKPQGAVGGPADRERRVTVPEEKKERREGEILAAVGASLRGKSAATINQSRWRNRCRISTTPSSLTLFSSPTVSNTAPEPHLDLLPSTHRPSLLIAAPKRVRGLMWLVDPSLMSSNRRGKFPS